MPATAISSNWKKLSKTLNKAKPIALPAAKKAKIEPLIKEEIDAVQLQELEKLSSTEITQRDLMIAEKILAGNADYNGESSGEDEQSAVPAVKKRAATMISIPNEK